MAKLSCHPSMASAQARLRSLSMRVVAMVRWPWHAHIAPCPLRFSQIVSLRSWSPELSPRRGHQPAGRRAIATRAGQSGMRAPGVAGPKTKHVYVCRNCGEEVLQWSGQCKSCSEWST
jgi:hypothetical protein